MGIRRFLTPNDQQAAAPRRRWRIILAMIGLTGLVSLAWIGGPLAAQSEPVAMVSAEVCAPLLEQLWTVATEVCINRPEGFFCNGGGVPLAEPSGPVSNALAATGALVEIQAIDAVRTPPITAEIGSAGIAWLRRSDPTPLTALLVGDVGMRDITGPGQAAWQSVVFETSPAPPTCAAAPYNGLILQSPLGQPTRIMLNGVVLTLDDTVLVRTDGAQITFIALAGNATVLALGLDEAIYPGQQVQVPYDPANLGAPTGVPSVPAPLNARYVAHLPVPLFDRPLLLPQPGFISTQGAINLRTEPSTQALIVTQVPGGEVLTLLGRNEAGTWYHVRRSNGQTGWMFAELLARNVGEIRAVYASTPLPPQRLGEMGTHARVIAPAGANLRQGPDLVFPAISALDSGTLVELQARSPYSPWVRVNVNGAVGWLALITLETQAYIDALPVDWLAPQPPATPTPTRPPGSFGNAFPEPGSEER
ncbi:MAG: SH3 domain-containing protein [Chloroflexi bacterium]|nr:SH3 domain-containing protein [Chloroflexota bacterium]